MSRYVSVFSDSYDAAWDECCGDVDPGEGFGYGDCNGMGDGKGYGDTPFIDGPLTGDGSGEEPSCWSMPDYGAGGKESTYGASPDVDEDHPHPDAQIGGGAGRGAGDDGGGGYGDGRAVGGGGYGYNGRLVRCGESGDGEGSGDGFGDGIGQAYRLDNGINSTFVEETAFTGGNGHALGDGGGDGDVWVFDRGGVMTRAPMVKR